MSVGEESIDPSNNTIVQDDKPPTTGMFNDCYECMFNSYQQCVKNSGFSVVKRTRRKRY